jgi:hypothetical protein
MIAYSEFTEKHKDQHFDINLCTSGFNKKNVTLTLTSHTTHTS